MSYAEEEEDEYHYSDNEDGIDGSDVDVDMSEGAYDFGGGDSERKEVATKEKSYIILDKNELKKRQAKVLILLLVFCIPSYRLLE
jgi:hypothetical protein